MSSTKPHRFRFGAFELDASTGDLQRDGVSVRLQERPLRLLLILIGHAGTVVTREQLYQQLWSDRPAADVERALNPLVKQLRDALNDSADNPVFIHTIPRRGYQFLAAVEPLPVDTAAVGARPIVAGGSGETTAHVPARLPPTRHRSRAIYVVLSVLAVLGVALGVLVMRRERQALGSYREGTRRVWRCCHSTISRETTGSSSPTDCTRKRSFGSGDCSPADSR